MQIECRPANPAVLPDYTAYIWSGIEALIDISQELTFRLALSAASLLETRGEQRYERYLQNQKLYGFFPRLCMAGS